MSTDVHISTRSFQRHNFDAISTGCSTVHSEEIRIEQCYQRSNMPLNLLMFVNRAINTSIGRIESRIHNCIVLELYNSSRAESRKYVKSPARPAIAPASSVEI